jgi:hypothetical protein
LIRIPPFLSPEPYQAAEELAKVGGHKRGPAYAAQWLGNNAAQFAVYVPKSLKLAYPGPPEPEESICIENIEGAQATVLASNRGAAKKTSPTSTARPTSSPADSAGPMPPYTVFASMRFPDGLGLEMYGFASTAEQQNQLLAAIRTIRRVRKSY